MVQAGRLTEEDAEGVRAAAQSGDLDAAVCEIQRKHARAMVTTAVEDGRLTQEEAHALFDRLENGEHPRFLRRLRRELRRDIAVDG